MSECRSVLVDWLRFSGPRSRLEEVVRLLSGYYGAAEAGRGGKMWLDSELVWGCVRVCYDADVSGGARHCVVELPGSGLALLEVADQRALVRVLLSWGFKATRVDCAVDVRAAGGRLVANVVESCRRGELCGARTFEPRERRSGSELTAYGCNIGVRGRDGSGRYVRVYDKGLETGLAVAGVWERWEVEFSGECAAAVGLALGDASCDEEWEQVAESRALGAVEFRVANGARAMARRALVAWWEAFVQGVEAVRVRARRVAATLASYAQWLGRAVWPGLSALASRVGMDVAGFVEALCGEVREREAALRTCVGRELVAEWRAGRLIGSRGGGYVVGVFAGVG